MGHQPVHRPHQLAHVGQRRVRDRLEHARPEARPPLFGFAPQDGDASLVVGSADVHYQAAREPGDEPRVQVPDLRRGPVAREHDLAACHLERLGEAQQLRLHLLAVAQELDVVHQQHVHVLEAAAEGVPLPRGDGGVERFNPLVQRQILDVEAGRELLRGVAHGHEEVRLTEAGAAVNEQRVVG